MKERARIQFITYTLYTKNIKKSRYLPSSNLSIRFELLFAILQFGPSMWQQLGPFLQALSQLEKTIKNILLQQRTNFQKQTI